jgi:hypothetical protein
MIITDTHKLIIHATIEQTNDGWTGQTRFTLLTIKIWKVVKSRMKSQYCFKFKKYRHDCSNDVDN